MKINIIKSIPNESQVLLIPLFSDSLKNLPRDLGKNVLEFIKNRISHEKFAAKRGEMVATYIDGKKPQKIVVIGLGKEKFFRKALARSIGGRVGKHLKCWKFENVTVLNSAFSAKFIVEFFEGIRLSLYSFGIYKSAKKSEKFMLKNFNVVSNENVKKMEGALNRANSICETMDYVKDLVNSPSHIVNSARLVSEAQKIAKDNGYKVTVFGEKEFKKQKWGGMLAVARGASEEPKAIILEYKGAKNKNEKPLVFVGKGVVFDTGGYNLKPIYHIEDMHLDMAGAAVLLGLFKLLKKFGIKKNITAIIVTTENMINEKAYRPSDIVTMLSGLTVEITNTDAEGRMILADAMYYSQRLNPASIISVATLTGAVSVALGYRYAGVMGNDLKLRTALQKAGKEVDDLLWPLPMHQDYKKKMNGEVSDLRNRDIGTSQYAGSSKAGAFLSHFVGKNSWCHIDMGCSAYTDDPKEYEQKRATGQGLRLLINFLSK